MAGSIPHGTSSGYSYWKCRCDVCVAFKKAKDRAYYEANREKVKAKVNEYFLANRDLVRANGRRRYEANIVERRRVAREYARSHSAEAVARVQKWRQTPAARVTRRLEAQQRRLASPMSAEDREYAALLYLGPCAYCGDPATEVDHITPVARGGDGHWSNLTGACRSCNAHKHDRSLLMFLDDRRAS